MFRFIVMKEQGQVRKKYPSDISREQFEHIRPSLEGFKRRTRPRAVDLYEVFCALLYVLRSGCQWRMLPSDFPKWRIVYSYYEQWSDRQDENKPGLLKSVLKKIGWRHSCQPWPEGKNEFLYR